MVGVRLQMAESNSRLDCSQWATLLFRHRESVLVTDRQDTSGLRLIFCSAQLYRGGGQEVFLFPVALHDYSADVSAPANRTSYARQTLAHLACRDGKVSTLKS